MTRSKSSRDKSLSDLRESFRPINSIFKETRESIVRTKKWFIRSILHLEFRSRGILTVCCQSYFLVIKFSPNNSPNIFLYIYSSEELRTLSKREFYILKVYKNIRFLIFEFSFFIEFLNQKFV